MSSLSVLLQESDADTQSSFFDTLLSPFYKAATFFGITLKGASAEVNNTDKNASTMDAMIEQSEIPAAVIETAASKKRVYLSDDSSRAPPINTSGPSPSPSTSNPEVPIQVIIQNKKQLLNLSSAYAARISGSEPEATVARVTEINGHVPFNMNGFLDSFTKKNPWYPELDMRPPQGHLLSSEPTTGRWSPDRNDVSRTSSWPPSPDGGAPRGDPLRSEAATVTEIRPQRANGIAFPSNSPVVDRPVPANNIPYMSGFQSGFTDRPAIYDSRANTQPNYTYDNVPSGSRSIPYSPERKPGRLPPFPVLTSNDLPSNVNVPGMNVLPLVDKAAKPLADSLRRQPFPLYTKDSVSSETVPQYRPGFPLYPSSTNIASSPVYYPLKSNPYRGNSQPPSSVQFPNNYRSPQIGNMPPAPARYQPATATDHQLPFRPRFPDQFRPSIGAQQPAIHRLPSSPFDYQMPPPPPPSTAWSPPVPSKYRPSPPIYRPPMGQPAMAIPPYRKIITAYPNIIQCRPPFPTYQGAGGQLPGYLTALFDRDLPPIAYNPSNYQQAPPNAAARAPPPPRPAYITPSNRPNYAPVLVQGHLITQQPSRIQQPLITSNHLGGHYITAESSNSPPIEYNAPVSTVISGQVAPSIHTAPPKNSTTGDSNSTSIAAPTPQPLLTKIPASMLMSNATTAQTLSTNETIGNDTIETSKKNSTLK